MSMFSRFHRKPDASRIRGSHGRSGDSDAPRDAPRSADHAARFGHATVYFVLTQATAKPVNVGQAVERLLDAEVATTAAWPSEDGIRLAPSLAKVDRDAARLQAMYEMTHPATNESSVAVWRRHPFLSVQLITMALRNRRQSTSTESELDGDSGNSLEDTMSEIYTLVLDAQKVSLAERHLDAELLGGEAREEDRFARLLLRPTHHDLTVSGIEHRMTLEPRLLLHEDGAVQLTIGLSLPTGLDTTAIVEGSQPSSPLMTRSQIPEPYAGPKDKWADSTWSEELDAGVRLRDVSHDHSPANIGELLNVILGRVLSVIGIRGSGEWNLYPVVIAQAGDCCSDWAHNHPDSLALVAARSTPRPEERFLVDPGRDFSAVSDHSIFVNLASALVIHWSAWSPGIDDLQFTLLLEHTMLVYSRLRRLERDIRLFPSRRRKVLRIYRTALQLAEESRGASIRAGTARDISRQLLKDLGSPEISETISQGLSMLSERAATRASEKSARTANRFALVGVIVAALASVPSIPAILNLIAKQKEADPNATAWAVIQNIVSSPLQLSVLVLSAIAAYAVLSFVVLVVRVTRLLLRTRKRGYSSRLSRSLDVSFVDAGEPASSEERE